MSGKKIVKQKENIMERIVTEQKRFVDAYGRERIFYGINIVDKRKNSEDNKFGFKIDDDFLTQMTERGLNIIRLGTTWSMIEPEPNKYNDEYLDDMERILDLCESHGVYVFLDMHQDLYSPKCYGDGAPDWATITDEFEPKPPKFVWAAGYFWGKATQRAFDNFWNNREYKGKGLLEYYAEMWKHFAARFADHPALFGFDMLNEPFLGSDGGKLFKKLISTAVKTVLCDKRIKFTKLAGAFINKEKRDKVQYLDQITGEVLADVTRTAGAEYVKKFDTQKYSPFLNKISSAIREVTDNGILIMENCYWSNTCIPCYTPPIEINGVREKNFCFTPHGYDFMVDTPQYKYASNDRVGAIFAEHERTQDRLGVPVLVGEWGGFGGEGDDWLPHIEFLVNTFEKNKWSFTYWHYVDDMFNSSLMKVLSRPYPMAVAGTIDSYGFDQKNGVFSLSYEQGDCDKPTEIYVHKAPKTVEGGEYESVAVGSSGAAKLIFKDAPGVHNIKITF